MQNIQILTKAQFSIASLWEEYSKSPASYSVAPATLIQKKRAWAHFASWLATNHPELTRLKDITRRIAAEYIEAYRQGRSSLTVKFRLCVLREITRVCLSAVMEGPLSPENPWNSIILRRTAQHSRRELTLEESRRLIAAAAECGDEWQRLFLVCAYTGMRLGDCCRLKWSAVDFFSGTVTIIPHKTLRFSDGKLIRVPLHRDLVALLARARPASPEDFVVGFIAQDYAQRRWRLSRRLGEIFAKAGITTSILLEGRKRRTPEATFHSLRHSFVSFAVNSGMPAFLVKDIVGHSTLAMTNRYYHSDIRLARSAIERFPSITGNEGGYPQPPQNLPVLPPPLSNSNS